MSVVLVKILAAAWLSFNLERVITSSMDPDYDPTKRGLHVAFLIISITVLYLWCWEILWS